jgi:acyl-[acyl-carrier-protein]-phospholipid O-acyltransferase/long-chain-fatty-acid--[acyl-carrier-protein] ligase
MRLLDPETLGEKPGAQRGLLALRGGNIVAGYLEGKASEKFHDGWYNTGDIVRVDHEGFIFIEGRSSRFSKIGGEWFLTPRSSRRSPRPCHPKALRTA